MTQRVYSKSSDFYTTLKRDFFDSNDNLLKKARSQNNLYASQPKRLKCKLCNADLPSEFDFVSHEIPYTFCLECNHLNGCHEDTKKFIENIYIEDLGSNYSTNYIDANFLLRANKIYSPKLDFLLSHVDEHELKILDVGCGSGHFAFSASKMNIEVKGIDVSQNMINFGNHHINHHFGKSPLKKVDEDEFYDEVLNSKANVISALGVIEHLRYPQLFFECFAKSEANYIFYSVPMFSFSVFLENVAQYVFPRQLSGAHTHLFTNESIEKLNNLMEVKPVAAWRFGTDVVDLYRHLKVGIMKNKVSQKFVNELDSNFCEIIDDLQAVFDRSHFCSEIHVVAKK